MPAVAVALRVHAVSSSNWWLVVPILALALAPVGINAFVYKQTVYIQYSAIPSDVSQAGTLCVEDILNVSDMCFTCCLSHVEL